MMHLDIIIILISLKICTIEASSLNSDWRNRSCSSLNIGTYKCSPPLIDDFTQSAVNCTSNNLVRVPCFPADSVICENYVFDGKTVGFFKQVSCRYVTTYHYQTAVLLSIFLGIFGIDRFYLGKNEFKFCSQTFILFKLYNFNKKTKSGYIAVGVLKLCTFGFMFIGYLIDFLLIITQTLKPSDGSNYIVDYYGQVLYPHSQYNNMTFNLTLN